MIKGVGVSCAKVKTVFLNKLSLSKTRTFCVCYIQRAQEKAFLLLVSRSRGRVVHVPGEVVDVYFFFVFFMVVQFFSALAEKKKTSSQREAALAQTR